MRSHAVAHSAVTIVLDLDGTIADTSGDLVDAANAALCSEGFDEAPASAIKAAAGYGTKAMLHAALQALGTRADPERIQRMAIALVAYYETHIAVKTQLFPGFIEAAATLRTGGAKLVLCTNKRERLARRLLLELRISEVFDAIAGGDTFPFHKPDPRHITHLVAVVGGELRSTLMVGDSEADVGAARGAGIPVVVTSFGYASKPAQELGADAVMHHFRELPVLAHALLGTGPLLAAAPHAAEIG